MSHLSGIQLFIHLNIAFFIYLATAFGRLRMSYLNERCYTHLFVLEHDGSTKYTVAGVDLYSPAWKLNDWIVFKKAHAVTGNTKLSGHCHFENYQCLPLWVVYNEQIIQRFAPFGIKSQQFGYWGCMCCFNENDHMHCAMCQSNGDPFTWQQSGARQIHLIRHYRTHKDSKHREIQLSMPLFLNL